MDRKPDGPRKAILYCLLLPGVALMLAGSLITPRAGFSNVITLFGFPGSTFFLMGAVIFLAGIVLARMMRKSSRRG